MRVKAAGGSLSPVFRQILHTPQDEGGPAGLVAGPDAPARVPMEVFGKEHEILPVRIVSKFGDTSMAGATTVLIGKKYLHQPSGYLLGNLLETEQSAGPGGALHPEAVTVEVVIPLKGLDKEIVHRKPDGSAPVRVAAEKPRVGLARNVFDPVFRTIDLKDVRPLPVNPGEGTDTVGREEFSLVQQVAERPESAGETGME